MITNSTFSKAGYFTQSGNNFYQRLGVTLAIPILSNRINSTNLAKAKIGYLQAGLNLKNNELVLSQAVEQAYLNAFNAKEAYVSANEQLIAVTENYRIINEQYRLGGTTVFSLLLQLSCIYRQCRLIPSQSIQRCCNKRYMNSIPARRLHFKIIVVKNKPEMKKYKWIIIVVVIIIAGVAIWFWKFRTPEEVIIYKLKKCSLAQ